MMSKLADEIDKHYINQNVLVWMISLIGMGISEYYFSELRFLFYLCTIMSILMSLSVLYTIFAYSCEYADKKYSKIKERIKSKIIIH